MQEQHKNLIEVFIALLVMAGTPLFAKLILLPPNYIIFYRSAIAAIAILVYACIFGLKIRFDKPKDYFMMLFLGVILCVHWLALFHAIQVSTVAIAIIAIYTYPIITIFLEPLLCREKLKLTDVFLGLIVTFGILVIVVGHSSSNHILQGVFWGVLSAFLFSVRTILSRSYVKRYPGEVVLMYQIGVTAVVLMPFLFVNHIHMSNTHNHIFNIVLLGIIFTALPHSLYTKSLKTLKAKTIGIIGALQPLLAILIAALVLGEIPGIRVLFGGAIIISAVIYESHNSLKKNRNIKS